jgi:hypothetical protein
VDEDRVRVHGDIGMDPEVECGLPMESEGSYGDWCSEMEQTIEHEQVFTTTGASISP